MISRSKTNCPYHNLCITDVCPERYTSCVNYTERLSQERAISKGLDRGLSQAVLDRCRRAGL